MKTQCRNTLGLYFLKGENKMDENNKIEELEKRINDLERLYIQMADNQLLLSSTIKELLGIKSPSNKKSRRHS